MAIESELAPLQRWIAAAGALAEVASDKIDPVGVREGEYGAEDRSIVALAAVEAGEVLVTLRPGAFLSGSTWLARVDDKALEQAVQTAQLSATALTALALLYEAGAGKASPFAGYIEQLPRDIPLPLSWSKASRELLKHTTSYCICISQSAWIWFSDRGAVVQIPADRCRAGGECVPSPYCATGRDIPTGVA